MKIELNENEISLINEMLENHKKYLHERSKYVTDVSIAAMERTGKKFQAMTSLFIKLKMDKNEIRRND